MELTIVDDWSAAHTPVRFRGPVLVGAWSLADLKNEVSNLLDPGRREFMAQKRDGRAAGATILGSRASTLIVDDLGVYASQVWDAPAWQAKRPVSDNSA